MSSLSPETIEGLRESVANDREAVRLLDRAAAYVERGWVRTHDATDSEGKAVPPHSRRARCWCLRGALLAACVDIGIVKLVDNGDVYLDAVDVDRERTPSVRGRAFRAAAIACLGHEPSPFASLPSIVTHYNDTRATDQDAAARKLRGAARMIRRRQAVVEQGIREAARQPTLHDAQRVLGPRWEVE
jgi:hypothetical protein